MFDWLKSGRAAQRQLADVVRAVDKSRGAVEAVIGLPHVLSRQIIQRRWGDAVKPSNEEFDRTGIDGEWRFPPAHPSLRTVVRGDDSGRLVLGLITGEGEFAGISIFTRWSRFEPVSQWQVELADERTELAEALYEKLLGQAPDDPTSAS